MGVEFLAVYISQSNYGKTILTKDECLTEGTGFLSKPQEKFAINQFIELAFFGL